MFSVFCLIYIPCDNGQSSPCTPFAFGYDRIPSIFYPESGCKVVHRCPPVRVAGTGEKSISRLQDAFLRHVRQGHVPTKVLERYAKRVKDLTHRLVRTHAYPVAHGGFSDIWSCHLQDKQRPPKRVAVKAVRSVIANEEYQVKKEAVAQELRIWVKLEHRNILPLYGITHGFGRFPAFVCPWADNGTLSEYLEKFETQLDMKKRMKLLGDVAAGLRYMHSRHVVHGDLSGGNVLITKHGRACLSDFGLSTAVERVSDTTVSGTSFPGNIRWAAPEQLFYEYGINESASQLSNRQTDVYSFGSIMLQTLTGKLPFHGVQRVAQIVIMISRGNRPDRELGWDGETIPDVLWMFVERCWASPSERPSSKEIVRFIRDRISML